MDEELRNSLIQLVRFKFSKYPNVSLLADDIIHNAYVRLRSSKSYSPDKENYAYLSIVCIRLAYRMFLAQANDFSHVCLEQNGLSNCLECGAYRDCEDCGVGHNPGECNLGITAEEVTCLIIPYCDVERLDYLNKN